jgi:hypothetical protein
MNRKTRGKISLLVGVFEGCSRAAALMTPLAMRLEAW